MVSERDRILKLSEYVESLGLVVNIGKNKARGNKGFFTVKSEKFRIDLSKDLSDAEALRVLVHEFSHYIHYKNDMTLKSLKFLNAEIDNVLMEELISITVNLIPKETVKPLFDLRETLKKEIKTLQNQKSSMFMQFELQSRQKKLNSINRKISKINRYYNSITELFARSMECFMLKTEEFKLQAPNLHKVYLNYVKTDSEISNFIFLLKNEK